MCDRGRRAHRATPVAEHGPRGPAELHATVLTDLGAIAMDPGDARLRDPQRTVDSVVVAEDERNLLGRAQSGEEAELIVVALRFTPVADGSRRSGSPHPECGPDRLAAARTLFADWLSAYAEIPMIENNGHLLIDVPYQGNG
jgi:hypothetical protein